MQLAATAWAAATALVINRIAVRFAGPTSALFAAIAYLLVLPSLGGQSGQSPIFYNLFTALAGLALITSVGLGPAAIRGRALTAMLASGLAIAIKPVAAVEGAFFGLAFLWLLDRARLERQIILRTAIAMIAVALIPTLLPLAGYALAGNAPLDAYLYANFVSIFQKLSFGAEARLAGLAYFLLYATPLLLLAGYGAWLRRRDRNPLPGLLLGWIAAAVGGYLLVPHFFDHYALPLLVPLAVSSATAFDRPQGRIYLAALLVLSLIQGAILDWNGNRRAIADFERLSATVEAARHDGCLYVADGPSWLYASTGACRLTRYLFPPHLTLSTEAGAIGASPEAELSHILAARPAVVVTQDSQRGNHAPVIEARLTASLRRDYHPILRVPADADPLIATIIVWQRKDLAPARR